jgi:hypothetical protein
LFRLLTNIHSQPTVLEPAAYSWSTVEKFLTTLKIVEQSHFEVSVWSAEGFGDTYQSRWRGVPYNHADPTERYGISFARFRKCA